MPKIPLVLGSLATPINVRLANVIGLYYPNRTVLPLVGLFNDRVLELGTGVAFQGRSLTLADNVACVKGDSWSAIYRWGHEAPSL